MPWELQIESEAGRLGNLEDVQEVLSACLSGIEYYKEPSGPEKLEAMRQLNIDMPDSLMSIFENLRGSFRGRYEGQEFSFEFSFGIERKVEAVFLDVRGEGDPFPALAAIQKSTGWWIRDLSTNQLIESSGWDKFTEWRDHAIASLKNKE